jgi:selenocysteine lyase/cysteine desulfurase
MPAQVVSAVTDHIQLEARVGGYEAAAEMAERLDSVYDDVAALIGARRDEVAIMENATVAWDQAFYALDFKPGDRILTAQAEYAANYVAFLQRARRDASTLTKPDPVLLRIIDPLDAQLCERFHLSPYPESARRKFGHRPNEEAQRALR